MHFLQVQYNLKRVSDLPGATIDYYTEIPYFGKSFKAADLKKIIGDVKITYNNNVYTPKQAKAIKLKGKDSTSYNASIQITKLEGSGADLKKAQKAIKRSTKPKKGELGLLKIRVNPLNISAAVSNNQIEKPVISGKASKLTAKFKLLTSTGKKVTAKNGKKDSFGKQIKLTYDPQAKTVTFESEDFKGTLTEGQYNGEKIK